MANSKQVQPDPALSVGFFHKLVTKLPGVLFTYQISADGHSHCCPYISDQVKHLFGIDPGLLQGNADALFARIHPDDEGFLKDSILASAETLTPWRFRARLALETGEYEWFEAHSKPERQPDGSTLWFGEFYNIQHYKELERELRASEAEFSFQAGFQKLVAGLSAEFINLGFGTIDECIDELLERVGLFFGIDRAYLYEFSDDYTAITKTHQWLNRGVFSLVDVGQSITVESFSWWREQIRSLVEGRRVVFIENVIDAPVGATIKEQPAGSASIYGVPVWVRGRVLGFVGLDSLRHSHWRIDQADLLVIVAGLLSGALERHYLEQELLTQSIRDPLTGLHNRRYLLPRLEEFIGRASRYREDFVLAMFDIDHFKQINDSIGHLGGDHILRSITDLLRDQVRMTDVVARFGGEEFMVVFPDTDGAAAGLMVNRILAAVRAERFLFEGREVPVTVSAGVARAREQEGQQLTPDAIIQRADHRLYLAKQAGRDCAVDEGGTLHA